MNTLRVILSQSNLIKEAVKLKTNLLEIDDWVSKQDRLSNQDRRHHVPRRNPQPPHTMNGRRLPKRRCQRIIYTAIQYVRFAIGGMWHTCRDPPLRWGVPLPPALQSTPRSPASQTKHFAFDHLYRRGTVGSRVLHAQKAESPAAVATLSVYVTLVVLLTCGVPN